MEGSIDMRNINHKLKILNQFLLGNSETETRQQ